MRANSFLSPKTAWGWLMGQIYTFGELVITEDGQQTREVLNLGVEVYNPLSGWPFPGSWNQVKLDKYAADLLNFSYDLKGFDYTYSERMGRQVHYVIERLKKNPTTRQATMYLWLPEKDLETGRYKPCQITADYKYRNGLLRATHVFRSHDIKDAWPQNVYGLAKLLEFISTEAGYRPGSLSTISHSGHYYIENSKGCGEYAVGSA